MEKQFSPAKAGGNSKSKSIQKARAFKKPENPKSFDLKQHNELPQALACG